MSEVGAVSLAEVIRQLRGDLYMAAWQGEGKDPKFVVGPVELELSVVVDSTRGGGGTASLWVLDVSAEAKRSTQVTHRIKVTLQPVGPDGHPSQISGHAEDDEEDLSP
jgi:Trypsin-co-occurring domain 2